MSGLILIPTRSEYERLPDEFFAVAEDCDWAVACCGFGPIASAARSAALIERRKPDRVLLLGIGGTFADSVAVGEATDFDRVCCYGVGVGHGVNYLAAGELGFAHWDDQQTTIGDFLDLLPASPAGSPPARVLLTSPVASADHLEAAEKLETVPAAIVEDMEGFSVAVSCRIAEVPLTIIRGISNEVGDRNRDHWQIEAALHAAAQMAIEAVIARPVG